MIDGRAHGVLYTNTSRTKRPLLTLQTRAWHGIARLHVRTRLHLLQIACGARCDHPFIQRRLLSTVVDDAVSLRAARAPHAITNNHLVHGRIIFPGAGYLELARAAAMTDVAPVSYTHLTLPTILRV